MFRGAAIAGMRAVASPADVRQRLSGAGLPQHFRRWEKKTSALPLSKASTCLAGLDKTFGPRASDPLPAATGEVIGERPLSLT
jgi:hypothetical protein